MRGLEAQSGFGRTRFAMKPTESYLSALLITYALRFPFPPIPWQRMPRCTHRCSDCFSPSTRFTNERGRGQEIGKEEGETIGNREERYTSNYFFPTPFFLSTITLPSTREKSCARPGCHK